jgi:hypothetical protein
VHTFNIFDRLGPVPIRVPLPPSKIGNLADGTLFFLLRNQLEAGLLSSLAMA